MSSVPPSFETRVVLVTRVPVGRPSGHFSGDAGWPAVRGHAVGGVRVTKTQRLAGSPVVAGSGVVHPGFVWSTGWLPSVVTVTPALPSGGIGPCRRSIDSTT